MQYKRFINHDNVQEISEITLKTVYTARRVCSKMADTKKMPRDKRPFFWKRETLKTLRKPFEIEHNYASGT